MAGDMESTNSFVERGARRNKRKWTEYEDEKLVEALMEHVSTGNFKADNGFKPGCLTFLENSLQTKLPTAGIKGKPHMESRMKTLKKDFTAVYDIRYGANSSGFGWNSEDHVVAAPRDVWVQYLNVYPGAAKWQNTAMPCFRELSIIFGKDRATGAKWQNTAMPCFKLSIISGIDRATGNLAENLEVLQKFQVAKEIAKMKIL